MSDKDQVNQDVPTRITRIPPDGKPQPERTPKQERDLRQNHGAKLGPGSERDWTKQQEDDGRNQGAMDMRDLK